MRVKIRPRRYPDGRTVWTADIHVAPAGSSDTERFRVTAPPSVTTRSGAERWAGEQARKIAAEGRPRNTKRAREEKVAREAAERAAYVPTVGEFWPVYLDHLRANRVKPSTIDIYSAMWRLKLAPLLESTHLDRVTELDAQRVKSKMSKAAASSVNGALSVLSQMLKLAKVHHPSLTPPTIHGVKEPAREHLRFYDRGQAAALVAAAVGKPDRLVALLLALDAGLRANEVHALRWCDINEAAGELTVRHTMYRGQLNLPKSGKSRRIPLTRRLAQALAELGRTDEWVLPRVAHREGSKHAGQPVSLTATLRGLAKAAKVPDHRPHSLRHTFASLLLEAGASLQAVSKLLGHANVGITATVYCHMLPNADRQAVRQLDELTAEPAGVTDLALARARLRSGSQEVE